METQKKRTIADVVKDAGKGLALVGIGVGLGTIDYEATIRAMEAISEVNQNNSVFPAPVYAGLMLFTVGTATVAIMSTVQGVGKIFGYDPLKLKEEKPYQNE